MINIQDLLKYMVEQGASDLHLKVGNAPILRVNGILHPIDNLSRVNREDTVTIAAQILNKKQKQDFNENFEIDFAYSVSGLGRFRCNAFLQRGSIGLVFRAIPMTVPTIEDLNLPLVIKKLALEPRGLILVTGITGSGKTTTLASMIQHINQNRDVHIITIEDPIEYMHRDNRAVINQREVGADTKGFAKALRSGLRQDPDVILVGEMRDLETIDTAITAAETGHLVMSTLHTSDATGTINRIISMYPSYQQGQIRLELAEVLKGILSMRLIPKKDRKGRVPAVEVLIMTDIIRQGIIEPEKTLKIIEYIEAGQSQYGMQSFDQALLELFRNDLITYEQALMHSTRPADFALKVKGIQSTEESVKEHETQKFSLKHEAQQTGNKPSKASSDSMFTKF
jgi:twitching motility protein PilT